MNLKSNASEQKSRRLSALTFCFLRQRGPLYHCALPINFQSLFKCQLLETMPKFPLEIFDMIIDEVHHTFTEAPHYKYYTSPTVVPVNRSVINTHLRSCAWDSPLTYALQSTLARCALVCRSWLKHSRALQFKRVDLQVVSNHLSVLSDLLKSPVVTIIPYIRHLKLFIAYTGDVFRLDAALFSPFAAIETISLQWDQEPRFLEDNVNELDSPCTKSLMTDIIPFLHSRNALKKMQIRSWRSDTMLQSRAIVCACRHLEELELIECGNQIILPGDSLFHSMEIFPSTSLRTLKASDFTYGDHLFPWLLSLSSPLMTITTLRLNVQTFIDHLLRPSCGPLLKALTPCLEHLTIDHTAAATNKRMCRFTLRNMITYLNEYVLRDFVRRHRSGSHRSAEDPHAQRMLTQGRLVPNWPGLVTAHSPDRLCCPHMVALLAKYVLYVRS